MSEVLPLLMFLGTVLFLLLGYPVAFSLAGSALLFAVLGLYLNVFDVVFLGALPERLFGIMTNETLIAVPLFVLMGVILEKAKISEELLAVTEKLFGRIRGGMGLSICLVGGLLAASTGIVGATVVTMGLISLPAMLKRQYPNTLSTGIICASGTLGQIIPPSIVLVILGDVISSSYQMAQLELGNFSPDTVSVGDLFAGALIPGILLMFLYMLYVGVYAILNPQKVPKLPTEERIRLTDSEFLKSVVQAFLPPIILIVGVLGSILMGIATPTEAASVGVMGAVGISYVKKNWSLPVLKDVLLTTTNINAMVFTILIGANIFSLVFRGYSGDELVREYLLGMEAGKVASFLIVMLVIFVLGFFLDFFEITFVVVPIVGPILLQMGFDPVWLGVMIAVNLQTSFLTPPFGFSLFYLRGVTPPEIKTSQIYRGVIPFIVIQILVLAILWFFPELTSWLPNKLFS